MDDELVRTLFLAGMAAVTALVTLGGFLTPGAGSYQDGERHIDLRQLGPLLWGVAQFAGGRQTYSGYASWGRIRLWRRDFGPEHLRALGFAADDARALEGQTTGYFTLRPQPDGLVGVFFGFRFAQEGGRMRHRGRAPGVGRRWIRRSPP